MWKRSNSNLVLGFIVICEILNIAFGISAVWMQIIGKNELATVVFTNCIYHRLVFNHYFWSK